MGTLKEVRLEVGFWTKDPLTGFSFPSIYSVGTDGSSGVCFHLLKVVTFQTTENGLRVFLISYQTLLSVYRVDKRGYLSCHLVPISQRSRFSPIIQWITLIIDYSLTGNNKIVSTYTNIPFFHEFRGKQYTLGRTET